MPPAPRPVTASHPSRPLLYLLLVVGGLALVAPVAAQETPPGWLHLPPDGEPGEPLVVTGVVHDADGEPLGGTRLEVYQTDARGWYRQGPDGRELGARRARLAGTLVTAPDGRFRLETIRPGGYPHGRTPSHIHFRIGGTAGPEVTLFFEDDPRLDERTRRQIAPSGRAVFCRPERSGQQPWRCRVDLYRPGGA